MVLCQGALELAITVAPMPAMTRGKSADLFGQPAHLAAHPGVVQCRVAWRKLKRFTQAVALRQRWGMQARLAGAEIDGKSGIFLPFGAVVRKA